MKKFIKLGAVILMMVSSVFADVIPNDLQWPLKNKGVKDTSIFFGVEDAVESDSTVRHCTEGGVYNKNGSHFDTHAGHDIIANIGTKVYPVDDGVVKESKGSANGGGWGARIVIEHNNNGKKWTSVYWHLQDKDLVKNGTKVYKNTVIGKIVKTTNMKDVNHLHIGLRPLKYDSVFSKDGFGDCKDLKNFVNPLDFLPRKVYTLWDDSKAKSKDKSKNWNKSNNLDMFSGVGYDENSNSFGKALIRLFSNRSISHTAKYKVYAKFPVSSNRTNKAYYLIIVRDKNKKLDYSIKVVDQSDPKNRGHNVYLFEKQFNKYDSIVVYIFNADKTGKYISSDALLFIKQ